MNEQQECSMKIRSLKPYLIVKISSRYPWKRFQVEKRREKHSVCVCVYSIENIEGKRVANSHQNGLGRKGREENEK